MWKIDNLTEDAFIGYKSTDEIVTASSSAFICLTEDSFI
jgi:hypothetical protein